MLIELKIEEKETLMAVKKSNPEIFWTNPSIVAA
jgi:hypothetical protein